METYLTNNDWHDCKFVQVQAHRQLPDGSWTKKARWQWKTIDQIIAFSKRHNHTLIFNSIGHFEEKNKLSKQLSNLCFDFDCHDSYEFVQAKNSCLNIMDYFGDLGLEKEHIRIWFTGGRSYHIEIPHQVFDIEPQIELNLIMKHLAGHINGYLINCDDDCLEVDLNIYKNPNQLRLPNCYYPQHNAHKVEISWDELRDLDEQQLRDIAKNPRLPLHDLDSIVFEPIDDAVDWYQERLKEYQEIQTQEKERDTPVNPKAYRKLDAIPDGIPLCIADLRQNGIKGDGDRNKATMLDACFCRDKGIQLEDAQTIINQWVQFIPEDMTGCKLGRERQAATNHTVDYIYQNTKYKFACSYAIGLKLTCNRENCPLWKQKAFQKWGKNVKVIPGFTPKIRPTQSQTVDEVREIYADELQDYIASDRKEALFVRLLQGGGKSVTTLKTLRELKDIRVIYAAPRHEIIDELKTKGLIDRHIYPRDERHCKECKQANFYAKKRYNVIKKLCARKCEVGTDDCDYFEQFQPIQAGEIVGIVHEDLFIPFYMEKLLENIYFQNIPTVVIFDEPDPQKFFEKVNITNNNITEAINACKNPETKMLLASIRSAIEKLKQEERFIGKAAMKRILAEIPSDTTIEKLLGEAKEYASIADEYRAVKFDYKISYSGNAWLLQFKNRQIWIPEDASYIADYDGIIMVDPWVIKEKNLTPMPSDEKLPLNFLHDLVEKLSVEYEKYKEEEEYNSLITIGRLPGLKIPTIRLNLPKQFAISEETKLVLLDGSGIPDLLSVLIKREVKTWTAPLQPDVEVIQITNGSYGITTLFDKAGKKPRKACKRLIQLANQIVEEAPEDTAVFTWKSIEEVIREQQTNGGFNQQVEVDHYGNLESKNDYEDKQTVILLGTPTPNQNDLIELSNAVWADDTPLNTEMIKEGNWKEYQYADEQNNGYAAEVREYKDYRLNMILHTYREEEIVQAAHRHRPILQSGKRIILLTNVPIDNLPPSKLLTTKELEVETSSEFRVLVEVIKEVVEEHSGGWKELIMNLNKNHSVISINSLLQTGFNSLPTGGTLQRWFYMAMKNLNYLSTNLNCIKSGAGRPIKVWHKGSLDVSKIESLYQQTKDYVSQEVDDEQWIPKVGSNLLRILPWDRDDITTLPLHLQEVFTHSDNGESTIYFPFCLPYYVHYVDGDSIICNASFGEDCEICTQEHPVYLRYLSFVMPIANEEEPITEVKPYSYGDVVCQGLISLIAEANNDDIADRQKGRMVSFIREGTGIDTRYNDFIVSNKTLPLPDNIGIPDLYDYLKRKSKEIRRVY